MGHITRHPLSQASDALKRALRLQGFSLYDDVTMELVEDCRAVPLVERGIDGSGAPIPIQKDGWQLRTNLLSATLPQLAAEPSDAVMVAGRVFDAAAAVCPSRMKVEGALVDRDLSRADHEQLWGDVARELFGLQAQAELSWGDGGYRITAAAPGVEPFELGCAGEANWLARALYRSGAPLGDETLWLISLDADELALRLRSVPDRRSLYSFTAAVDGAPDAAPAYPQDFEGRIADALRALGFTEYVGPTLYEPDAYTKMNMFQGEWDLNNKPVLLKEPIGGRTGLPTVLVPGLEEAMSACYAAQIPSVRLFQIAHIFLPGAEGQHPVEKVAVSVGGYGDGLDVRTFRGLVDKFLSSIEVGNHFFIPTDIPIPYWPGECFLVLDEKMNYLEANFGGACKLAEDNHGVGEHMFISQFELGPLQRKAAEEHGFIPWEERDA